MRLRRQQRLPERVVLTASASAVIRDAANHAYPLETGGILIGWRNAELIHVDEAIVIDDPNASQTSYERDHAAGSAELERVLAEQPAGSPIGYAGEWHCHPAKGGPSVPDRATILSIGSRTNDAVALLVAVLVRPSVWEISGLVSHKRRGVLAVVEDPDLEQA